MPIRHYFKTGALVACVFFILAVICVNFVDKPLALYMHAQRVDQWHWLLYVTEYEILALIIFSLAILCIFPTDKVFWKRVLFLVCAVIASYLAIWIRRKLGVMCARSWPSVWAHSGIYGGLIGDAQFGFHFLQTSIWKGSFPSGHSTETSFICCIMFLAYSRFQYKYCWWLPLIVMVMGQVLQNFHFLGDCLAGVGLGILVAYVGVGFYMWLMESAISRYVKISKNDTA